MTTRVPTIFGRSKKINYAVSMFFFYEILQPEKKLNEF